MQAIELGIKTKKVVYRGEKFYKILSYGCYEVDILPFEYFKQFPYCFDADGEFMVVVASNRDEDVYELRVGDIIPQDEFEKMFKVIKYCGRKLHEINEKIREIRKEWNGEQEFKI
jgi:hypothetical protein